MGFIYLLLSNVRAYRKLRKGKWYAKIVHVGHSKSITYWKHEKDVTGFDVVFFDVEEY